MAASSVLVSCRRATDDSRGTQVVPVGGSGSRCAFKSVFERPSRQDRLIEVATDLHRHDRPRRPLAWGTRGAADEAVYGEGIPESLQRWARHGRCVGLTYAGRAVWTKRPNSTPVASKVASRARPTSAFRRLFQSRGQHPAGIRAGFLGHHAPVPLSGAVHPQLSDVAAHVLQPVTDGGTLPEWTVRHPRAEPPIVRRLEQEVEVLIGPQRHGWLFR